MDMEGTPGKLVYFPLKEIIIIPVVIDSLHTQIEKHAPSSHQQKAFVGGNLRDPIPR